MLIIQLHILQRTLAIFATRMPGSIIEYAAAATAALSTSVLLLAEQLQPLAAAAATVCIASL